jgi:ribose transport system substrate-binding protein
MSRSHRVARGMLLALSGLFLWVASGCMQASIEAPRQLEEQVRLDENHRPPSFTFGIIYPMAHPFYEMLTQLAEEAAKRSGIQIVVKAPEDISLEQQIRMMETMIKQKVDGIAISPIDADALAPIIDKAVEAGIPVVCFESDSPSSRRLAFIGPSYEESGKRMGEVVQQLLKGRGMILVENGSPDVAAQFERLQGMLNYLDQYTEIQVLDVRHNHGSRDRAMTDLEIMIDEHPHFDALVTLDVISSSTSILVWKAKGLNRDAVAFGMMPDVQEALRNGQITAVVSQNEQDWGKRIVESLVDAASGKPLPTHIDTGTQVITRNGLTSVPLAR